MRISIDSMSSGFRSAARFCMAVPSTTFCASPANTPSTALLAFEIGVPSTTNRGWLLPVSVLEPRIRMYAPAAGSPDWLVTSTFGALPASAATTFVSWLPTTSSAETVFTVLPRRRRSCCVPCPVATISSSRIGSSARLKSWLTRAPGLRTTLACCVR